MCSIGSFDTLSLITYEGALSNEPNAGYGDWCRKETDKRIASVSTLMWILVLKPALAATESCCLPFSSARCSAGDYASEKKTI